MQSFSGTFCCSPCCPSGRHILRGQSVAQSGSLRALATGFLRNRKVLERELGCACCSDSELLLHAYRRWDEDCVLHIEGPCALIVLDGAQNRLLLCRDRMGEIPLFVACREEEICFASHPELLLQMGITPTVDASGLCEIFGLGPARTPGKTPYRDIFQLEAGQLLSARKGRHCIRTYFSLTPQEHSDSLSRTIETVRGLTEQAVADIAPLHPASMLSGGLDSTALTALLARFSPQQVDSYSIDYEDNARYFQGGSYQPEQDAPYVTQAVSLLNTRHQSVVLSIDSLVDSLDQSMAARGFPGMADIDSSLYCFARSIAQRHRYVLSGECGDEVFGGYPWFHRDHLIHSGCFPWSGSLPLRCSILRREVAEKLRLEQFVQDTYCREVELAPRLSGECAEDARLRQLQTLCFRYFMTNLQERAACMCAAFDLQVLTPFCDERLVQYVYNVPWQMKNTGGMEKGLLREALSGVLPDSLRMRRKSPFPKTYHPHYARLVTEKMRALLDDADAPLLQLVDPEALRSLMSSPLSPQDTPWFGQLMAGPQMLAYLLQVNQWLTRYRVNISL